MAERKITVATTTKEIILKQSILYCGCGWEALSERYAFDAFFVALFLCVLTIRIQRKIWHRCEHTWGPLARSKATAALVGRNVLFITRSD